MEQVFLTADGALVIDSTGVSFLKYSESQGRDDHGRFGSGSGPSHAQILAQPSSAYPPANPAGKDTESRFKDANGKWTPERAALHEAILTKFLGQHEKQEHPIATFMGGGPAAGKSSILDQIDLPKDAVKVDVDQLRTGLPEYGEHLASGNPAGAAVTHEEASYLGKELTSRAAEAGYNIVLDGTGDTSLASVAAKAEKMKAKGYDVCAHYVTVDTETAVARAEQRGREGKEKGRFVPETFIRQTHAAVSQILPEAIKAGVFSRVGLWDTTGGKTQRIASAEGKTLTVHHPQAWDRFVAKGKG